MLLWWWAKTLLSRLAEQGASHPDPGLRSYEGSWWSTAITVTVLVTLFIISMVWFIRQGHRDD